MGKQLSRSSAGTGQGSTGSRLCCPTAHVTELTPLIAFLSQLCAAGLSHQDCRSGRRQTLPVQPYTQLWHSQEGEELQNQPSIPAPPAHPNLCSGAPDQALPWAMGSCHRAILLQGSPVQTSVPWDPGWGTAQDKSEIAPAAWLVLQQQELPGALHRLR